MSAIERTCAFTGYRPQKLGFALFDPKFEILLKRIDEEIEKLIISGIDIFITGMSRGTDMWAAESVIKLQKKYKNVKLCAAVPFEGQEKRWQKADKERYYKILSKCASTKIICENIDDYPNINVCYHIRNRFMTDHSSVLFAVYDTEKRNWGSGTKATLDYAKKLGKKTVIINPAQIDTKKGL